MLSACISSFEYIIGDRLRRKKYSIMGKCVFNRKWLTDQKYKSWVREFKSDKHSVICCLCIKIIDLGKIGEYAVNSHMKSKKHVQCTPAATTTPIAAAFKSAPKTSVDPIHGICTASELTIPLPTDDFQSGNILPTHVCKHCNIRLVCFLE